MLNYPTSTTMRERMEQKRNDSKTITENIKTNLSKKDLNL